MRSLREETLIIIDNFNTLPHKDEVFDVVMKYNCHILFTTRSKFENYATFELSEIENINTLVDFSGNFYSEIETEKETVTSIIETIHKHTLSVEMSARLLEKGLLKPREVLEKLSENIANIDNDKISILKDGKTSKATYYGHIHTLFSLYALDENTQNIMRCMTFIPISGISKRLFAELLELKDLNDINDLIELGYIQYNCGKISLHPMLQEVCISDLKPSVTNCLDFLETLRFVCLKHGIDVPYYKELFATIENIIKIIDKNNIKMYFSFLCDVYPYMEKFGYISGMKIILNELVKFGDNDDYARLYDFKAAYEEYANKDRKKALKFELQALGYCKNLTENNIHLYANINMNVGYFYHHSGDLKNAKNYMETSMDLFKQSGIMCNDIIIVTHNYSNLLADLGEREKALSVMKNCADLIKENNTDLCSDYADFYYDMGAISVQINNISQAVKYFKEAFRVYEIIFENDKNYVREKYNLILLLAQKFRVPPSQFSDKILLQNTL